MLGFGAGDEASEATADCVGAVPAHHIGRDLIADQIGEDRRVTIASPYSGDHRLADLLLGCRAVEKGDVLRPRQSDEDLQTGQLRGIEQPGRRHREDPDGVDAGFGHQCEIGIDDRVFGELRPVTAGWEGAVSDAFDEVLFVADKKELALNPDRSGTVKRRCCRRKRLRHDLFGFDYRHDGSSRDACSGSQPASGAALA